MSSVTTDFSGLIKGSSLDLTKSSAKWDGTIKISCQVIDVAQTHGTNDGDIRYRLRLSDGACWVYATVCKELNTHVSLAVRANDIICIDDYMSSRVQNKQVVVLIRFCVTNRLNYTVGPSNHIRDYSPVELDTTIPVLWQHLFIDVCGVWCLVNLQVICVVCVKIYVENWRMSQSEV